jgi:hypothetical protein
MRGRVFETPYAALTDGSRWLWYQISPSQGLVRIDGPEAVDGAAPTA